MHLLLYKHLLGHLPWQTRQMSSAEPHRVTIICFLLSLILLAVQTSNTRHRLWNTRCAPCDEGLADRGVTGACSAELRTAEISETTVAAGAKPAKIRQGHL